MLQDARLPDRRRLLPRGQHPVVRRGVPRLQRVHRRQVHDRRRLRQELGPGDLRYTFQWGGTRRRQLQQFAKTDGCPQLHTQLAFADKELRNDAKYACFWDATTEAGAYAALRRGFGQGSC